MPTSRTSRPYAGLGVFLLYCALLAVVGPAMFWSARLGMRVAPVRVHGFVGYFVSAEGEGISHVAIPLEDGSDLYLSGAEIPGLIPPGTVVEKRRGELAFRFDGAPAEWPLQASHIVLLAGGLAALVVLSVLLGRSGFPNSRLRALTWLRAPARIALLLLPGAGTLLVGVVVAFLRGDLDRVTAVATIGAALAGGVGGYRGTWRRLRERVVLARAQRLAATSVAGTERAVGVVRRVERDFVELALTGASGEGRTGESVQADLSACERLGLGVAPHPPIAVGDRLEVLGAPEHVADPTAEGLSRGVALARRLCASGARPVLVAAVSPPAPAPRRAPAQAAASESTVGAGV